MKLLHVDSSIQGTNSASRLVTAAIVAKLQRVIPNLDIHYRDLVAMPMPHLTLAHLPHDHPLSRVDALLDHDGSAQLISKQVLDEFLQSDVVVIGVPMYNFSIPSQLKAWIDRIVIPGRTFHYAEGRAQGLVGDKRVILAVTRGGSYEPPALTAAFEYAQSYLRSIFTFIGISHPVVIVAEGLQLGAETRAAALDRAIASVDSIIDASIAA